MYTKSLNIRDYQITHIPQYINSSKKCINSLINGIIKCAPVIAAFITIGTVFSLMEGVGSRYIPYDKLARSSTTVFVPDDVKMVPLNEAIWIPLVKSPHGFNLKKCTWSNFFCARPF